MKLFGAIFFVIATSFIGFDISNQLSLRTRQLRMFIYSLQMIEAEMTYSHHTLRQIFLNITNKTSGPIAIFYKRLATRLNEPIADFFSLWESELKKLHEISKLKKQEIDILNQFGKNIGIHTIEQQMKQIKLTNYYLQQQLDEAVEQKNKYDKTVKSLGFLFGLLIVLILI